MEQHLRVCRITRYVLDFHTYICRPCATKAAFTPSFGDILTFSHTLVCVEVRWLKDYWPFSCNVFFSTYDIIYAEGSSTEHTA